MLDAQYPIQLVARLTGLSAHVIRIWEQRYRAVEPRRTSSNRRLYSQSEIERLSLLRDLIHAGHRIGQLARLPDQKLRRLVAESPGTNRPARRAASPALEGSPLVNECLAAIQSLDTRALSDVLKRAGVSLGVQGVLQRLLGPLTHTVGDWWREGRITAAHEHFASSAIRAFLSNLAKPFSGSDRAPVLVVATPAGQLHEVGALLVGAMAANLGWQVIQLGASLPAVEIAGAAREKQARAVALSLVYPGDDASLPGELTRLREALPAETSLLVGGRAARAYREALVRVGAKLVEDLGQLGAALDGLRKPASKVKQ
jgi:methanogenic corrinoid protein MtbC1